MNDLKIDREIFPHKNAHMKASFSSVILSCISEVLFYEYFSIATEVIK